MTVLPVVLPPLFGFAIGYVTNAVAIRMLFRPYREIRFLGLRFQGMVPRRQAAIARSVAGTVATEFLREERLAERLTGPEVRRALVEVVADLGTRFVGTGHRCLSDALGPERTETARKVGTALIREAAAAAGQWCRTPAGGAAVGSLVQGVLERTPAELLPGQERLASQVAAGKLALWLESPDLPPRVRAATARLAVRLAAVDRPLGELVPAELRQGLRSAVADMVPALLRRFEDALLAPSNVERIKAAVRDGIVAYLTEERGGMVRGLVRQAARLARDRIHREADGIVDANLHRLKELIYARENRERVEAAIDEALDRLWSRRPADLLAAVPAETLDLVYDRLSGWVCRCLSRPEVAETLVSLGERELDRAFRTPLGELAALADPEAPARLVAAVARWAGEGGFEALAVREAERWVEVVLHAHPPAGRALVSEPLLREVTDLVLERLMPLAGARLPAVLEAVDVAGLVEREILGFAPEQVERVILSVSRKELRAITWWGGVLGALVGAMQAVLTLAF